MVFCPSISCMQKERAIFRAKFSRWENFASPRSTCPERGLHPRRMRKVLISPYHASRSFHQVFLLLFGKNARVNSFISCSHSSFCFGEIFMNLASLSSSLSHPNFIAITFVNVRFWSTREVAICPPFFLPVGFFAMLYPVNYNFLRGIVYPIDHPKISRPEPVAFIGS